MAKVKGEGIEQGVKSDTQGVVVPPEERVPYDKENIRLSKAQFVAKQQALREKKAKLRAYEAELDKGAVEAAPEVETAPKVEDEPKKKTRGRPAKIE